MADQRDVSAEAVTKVSLDKDLAKFIYIEKASRVFSKRMLPAIISVLFLVVVGVSVIGIMGGQPEGALIVVASIIAGYLALNIGANDVANNVSPAVGARALTIGGALVLAAIFETAGALIAGGNVVSTVAKSIIDPTLSPDGRTFIWAMMAALLSSAMWIHLATYLGAPVSTTHAVVGGVMGAGIAAIGFHAVNWPTMGAIAASWVISPLMGGLIAALFLAFIKIFIIYRDDKIAAARRWVPILVAIMTSAFSYYLITKGGLSRIYGITSAQAVTAALLILGGSYALLKPWVQKKSEGMENRNQSLRVLFHLPLIFAAMLLSFAHGANDVANAIGPLAAILSTLQSGSIGRTVELPLWVLLIGGIGISVGLALFGPRLIRVVGAQITKMNPMRAFCVALSAALTVIVASELGLPVSSTHIAVGGVFGVGFFREYYTSRSQRRRNYVLSKRQKYHGAKAELPPQDLITRKLVRRSHFMMIIAAWLVTVPASTMLSATVFWVLSTAF